MTVISPPPLPNTPLPSGTEDNAAVIAPPEADQPSAVGNDDRYNDLEQQLVGIFESRAANSAGTDPTKPINADDAVESTGDGGGGSGEAVISPADQPTPTISPVVDPISAPTESASGAAAPVPEPVSGIQVPEPGTSYDPFALPGESAPAQTPNGVVSDAQSQTATPPQTTQIPPGYVDFMGSQMPIQEARTMQDTYNWAQSLTPDEANAVNQFLQQRRAQQFPQPNNGLGNQQQPQTYQQPQPNGVTSPIAPPQLDPNTFEDPQVAAFFNQQSQYMQQQNAILQQQQQQIAELSQGVGNIYQSSVQQQQSEAQNSLDRARKDFIDRYQLTPGELSQVESRLERSGLLPGLVQQRNGDIYQSLMDGFETTSWTSPDLRQRLIASQVQPAIDDARDTQTRAAKLGALAGSGGSVARTESTPTNTKQRHDAMVSEIAAAMNQQPS